MNTNENVSAHWLASRLRAAGAPIAVKVDGRFRTVTNAWLVSENLVLVTFVDGATERFGPFSSFIII